jgi:hypothetical protein
MHPTRDTEPLSPFAFPKFPLLSELILPKHAQPISTVLPGHDKSTTIPSTAARKVRCLSPYLASPVGKPVGSLGLIMNIGLTRALARPI